MNRKTGRSVDASLRRFVDWAKTQSDIVALINQGSRARKNHPADQWSDLDLILCTTDKQRYLSSSDWLGNLGRVVLTFLEKTATGDELERRALFEDGLDADVSIISREDLVNTAKDPSPQDQDMISRGIRVLLDKEGLLTNVPRSSKKIALVKQPSREEFDQLVNDFLYHVVWTAKKLRRGELWTAKACCDSYMKRRLLQMIEWHTLASRGWDSDIWFNGRFLEEWADPSIVKTLRGTFAHYDYEDVKRALLATTNLFLEIATMTVQELRYGKSIPQAQSVMKLVSSYLPSRIP